MSQFDEIKLRRSVELQRWITRRKKVRAGKSAVKIPKFLQRVARIGWAVREKGLQHRSLTAIEVPRSSNVSALRIRRKFVLNANRLPDMKSGKRGVDSDFQVNVGRIGGKGLLMLRFECALRPRGGHASQTSKPK
jgi:hypothetical protein